MFKIIKSLGLLLLLMGVLVLPYFVFAQAPAQDRLEDIQEKSSYAEADSTTVSEIIGKVVNGAFALLGVIFIILIIIGGYYWMTAAGNEDKAKQGTDIIRRAIIGLLIIAGSWAIWTFVSGYILG